MRDLNPIGREDDVLLLVASDGERFRVQVDETLLRTIKEHRVPDSNVRELSPREIQDAIRAGATVADLAASSGGSLEIIERFAYPVLEELSHMIELATSVRVELPADRFNDVQKKAFGEIVEEKLFQAGASQPKWSARRGENTLWEISVSFKQADEEGAATWTFDPKRYLLTPETPNAASLSTPSAVFDSPLGSQTRSPSPIITAPIEEASVVTADKLEAFRKRREQAEVTQSVEIVEVVEETIVELEQVEIVELVETIPDDLGEEPQLGEPADEEHQAPAPVETKRTRPPMPSWDQIVRGTQSEDGEAF
ncbi:MAG: hypothetical protein RL197_414 [Actinomycetota bacterium]|jgi:hypothetical protein